MRARVTTTCTARTLRCTARCHTFYTRHTHAHRSGLPGYVPLRCTLRCAVSASLHSLRLLIPLHLHTLPLASYFGLPLRGSHTAITVRSVTLLRSRWIAFYGLRDHAAHATLPRFTLPRSACVRSHGCYARYFADYAFRVRALHWVTVAFCARSSTPRTFCRFTAFTFTRYTDRFTAAHTGWFTVLDSHATTRFCYACLPHSTFTAGYLPHRALTCRIALRTGLPHAYGLHSTQFCLDSRTRVGYACALRSRAVSCTALPRSGLRSVATVTGSAVTAAQFTRYLTWFAADFAFTPPSLRSTAHIWILRPWFLHSHRCDYVLDLPCCYVLPRYALVSFYLRLRTFATHRCHTLRLTVASPVG